MVGLWSVPGTLWAQTTKTAKTPRADALPATIPIFPLPDVVLFPNVSQQFHIFEPRYRAMVADALQGDGIIGMVLLQPGYEANYEGRPPINPIGCAGVITEVEQLPDGRFNIVLRGLVKIRVTGEDSSRPYRLARVEALPEVPDEEERAALGRQRQRLETLLAPAPGVEAKFSPEIADADLVNALAHSLEVEPSERQALLERQGALARSRALIEMLEKLLTPR